MSDIKRKVSRLLRMPPREILSRAVEQWHVSREGFTALTGFGIGRLATFGQSDACASLSGTCSKPFYGVQPSISRDESSRSFSALFPGRVESIVREAEAICAGSIRLLGQEVQVGSDEIDWRLDWETGDRWPLVFYRRILLVDAARQSDPKRVWELNRQQFLLTLGKAYSLTGERKFAAQAVRLIESWIKQNPPYKGVNWRDGLEVGLRLISWAWTLRLISDFEEIDEDVSRTIVRSIFCQLGFIEQHLSVYTSPNTHVLGEALALFVISLYFRGMDGTDRRAATALQILESQLAEQVGDDGGHKEKSTYYHCYALDMYLLATVLGKQHGISFSAAWMRRVEKMAEYLLATMRPDGSLARLGDDDGGRTIRVGDADYYRPGSLLALSAVLFDRGDFKHVAGDLAEEVYWILGMEGVEADDRLEAREPAQTHFWHSEARTTSIRTGWKREDTWLICQEYPMGMQSAGHSHAGLLSFELVLCGRLLILDPGTYSYLTSSPWRDYFRGQKAHTTVAIDEMEWFRPDGPFRWQENSPVKGVSPETPDSTGITLGYEAAGRAGSIHHTRKFEVVSQQAVTVEDRFMGEENHTLRYRLQFAPGCRIERVGRDAIEIRLGEDCASLNLGGFGELNWNLWEGSLEPMAGWVSPHYGQKCPAPTLCLEETVQLPAVRTLSFEMMSGQEARSRRGAAADIQQTVNISGKGL